MATQSMQAFMARAKAVADARKNRPAESFWPNVKKWLVSHEGNQPMPTCPVCYTELDIQGIGPVPTLDSTPSPPSSPASSLCPSSSSSPSSSPPSSPPSSSSPPPSPDHDHDHDQYNCGAEGMASVLPCGHMMCHNCILTTMLEMADDASALFPVCRTSCRGGGDDVDGTCGHRVHYHVATAGTDTRDDPNWIERIPLTIPEGGGIPEMCWACATHEHIYPMPLSEDEEFSSPDTSVFWDLLLLEDESKSEGQTAVPSSRHNVPGEHEAERVGEPNGDASSPGDQDLFEERRTARPQNGRVTPHHCCYYDGIFKKIHSVRIVFATMRMLDNDERLSELFADQISGILYRMLAEIREGRGEGVGDDNGRRPNDLRPGRRRSL